MSSFYWSPFEPKYLVYWVRIIPGEANLIYKTNDVCKKNEYIKNNPYLCVYNTRKGKVIQRSKAI